MKDIPEESVDQSVKDIYISGLNSLLSPWSLSSDSDNELLKEDLQDPMSSEPTIDKIHSHSFFKKANN